MTQTNVSNGYNVRIATTPADLAACQALRHMRFFGHAGYDQDRFDAGATHLMCEDRSTGQLACTLRLLDYQNGAAMQGGYTGQFYDLSRWSAIPAPVTEVGRLCIAHDVADLDVIRYAFAAITRHVDAHKTGWLFGCSSFAGSDAAPHLASLTLLRARFAGPDGLCPAPRAPDHIALGNRPPADVAAAMRAMPPLLKTYLSMGGWVGTDAVIDRSLDTLHVFTAVQIATIPPARAKALRALAAKL